MTVKALLHIIKEFARSIGVAKLAPHVLRRTGARLCHPSEASWRRSSFSWGTFRFRRPNATSAASSGFDQPSMIALASNRSPDVAAPIVEGLPTIHNLPDQTTSKALFLLKISGLSAIAVNCLPEPCVALRRRSLSRADLLEDFVGAEFYGSGERDYLVPAGAFGFKSAVQFSTTLICPGDCSEALSIRKRWPSGDTS